MLDALLVVYRVHWGFSSRAPWGSVVQPSYLLPPPTTILGAFAKALHSLDRLEAGEFTHTGILASGAAKILEYLGDKWLVTAAWLSPVVKTGVLIRYFNGPYQSFKTRHEDIIETLNVSELFGPYKLGYTVSPHGLLAVLVSPCRSELLEAALHISRLGSKESFVDPVATYRAVLEEGVKMEGVSPWLTPMDCIESVEGNYVVEKTPLPYTREELICAYSAEPCTGLGIESRIGLVRVAVHPRYPGWARVKVARSCSAYRIAQLEKIEVVTRDPRANAQAELLLDTLLAVR